MFQMGGVGPMFGQLGFFYKFAGREIDDPRPRDRYIGEAKRLLAVVDGHAGRARLDRGRLFHRRHRLAPWLRRRSISTGARGGGLARSQQPAKAYLDRFLTGPPCRKAVNTPPRDPRWLSRGASR
jgi:GST-like protein